MNVHSQLQQWPGDWRVHYYLFKTMVKLLSSQHNGPLLGKKKSTNYKGRSWRWPHYVFRPEAISTWTFTVLANKSEKRWVHDFWIELQKDGQDWLNEDKTTLLPKEEQKRSCSTYLSKASSTQSFGSEHIVWLTTNRPLKSNEYLFFFRLNVSALEQAWTSSMAS